MSEYKKTTWIDHIENGGTTIQQGTTFDQDKMNKIEEGIFTAHEEIETSKAEIEASKIVEIPITLLASGWSVAKTYILQEPRLTAVTEGELIEGNNTDEEHMALAKACISRETVVSAGELVITARGTIPTMDVKVKLKVRKF